MNLTIRYRLRKVVTHDYGKDLPVRRIGHFTRDTSQTPILKGVGHPGPVILEMPVTPQAKHGDLYELVFGKAE